MDDIIQIIVVLFFIWSIFGSISKKKKEEQKKFPQKPTGKAGRPLPSSSQRSSEEILGEIFGMKIPKPVPDYTYQNNYEDVDIEKDAKDLEETPTDYKNDAWNIDYDKQAKLENNLKALEPDSSIPDLVPDPRCAVSNRIKRKIKNSSTLKDAILISEILNKPKSLRR